MHSVPLQPPSWRRIGVVLLVLAQLLVVGCGDEDAPSLETLSLREILGMRTDRIAELSSGDRHRIWQRIESEWTGAPDPRVIETNPEAANEDGLIPPITVVNAFDGVLAAEGEAVLVSGRIDTLDAGAAEIRATPIPSQVLGIDGNAEVVVKPLEAEEVAFDGPLYWDPAWGRVEVDVLDGRSERETVEVLEPAVRRYLHQMGLTTESAQVVRSESAPAVFWYAEAHRAVLINPTLLYVLDQPALSRAAARPTSVAVASEVQFLQPAPEFIENCVDDQRARCSSCFGSQGVPNRTVCDPLFADVEQAGAKAECDWMAEQEGRGFYLYCYHNAATSNFACMARQDPDDICGTRAVPVERLEDLEKVGPMVDAPVCQEMLQACYEGRIIEPTTPEPPPSTASDDDDDEAWEVCADIMGSICEGASCGSDDDDGDDSDDEGGLCEGDDGDGGLCEGDDAEGAEASIVRSGSNGRRGLLVGLPFLFLLAVWICSRPLAGSSPSQASSGPRDGENAEP